LPDFKLQKNDNKKSKNKPFICQKDKKIKLLLIKMTYVWHFDYEKGSTDVYFTHEFSGIIHVYLNTHEF